MAITITQERKKQRYLLLAFSAIIFAILFVVWLGFSKKEESVLQPSGQAVYAVLKIEINRQLLDELRSKNLKPFEEIKPFEKAFGRKNPFISY